MNNKRTKEDLRELQALPLDLIYGKDFIKY